MGRTGSSGSGGRHFAPASLTRFGGFGEPGAEPVWKRPSVNDSEKLRSAQAQDHFVRHIRELLQLQDMSEVDLESELGYKPRTLVRKFKGYEQLTLRDVLRIGDRFGPEAVSFLIGRETGAVVADSRRKPVGKGDEGQAAIREAAERLLEAADIVRRSNPSLSNVLSKTAELVLELDRLS